MRHQTSIKSTLWSLTAVLLVSLNWPMPARASGALIVDERGHRGAYTEVVVGPDRYYYDRGIFYTGAPGSYVAVGAPVGAVVYTIPAGYEQVEIEGATYFVYQDVYYRPARGGYEVVRMNDHGRHHGWGHGHGR